MLVIVGVTVLVGVIVGVILGVILGVIDGVGVIVGVLVGVGVKQTAQSPYVSISPLDNKSPTTKTDGLEQIPVQEIQLGPAAGIVNIEL